MRLTDLVFVTSNANKLREAESVLETALDHQALEVDEIQSLSVEAVVRHKARSAHQHLDRPVIVEDTALELAAMNGFPGPLVRWLLTAIGPSGIARLTHAFDEPTATARCVVCATDGAKEILGEGVVAGSIATEPRGGGGFGWDSVFIPDEGGGATYAEMTTTAKNAISHRRRAFLALRNALEKGEAR